MRAQRLKGVAGFRPGRRRRASLVLVAVLAVSTAAPIALPVAAGEALAGAARPAAAPSPSASFPATWTETNGSGGADPDMACGNWFVTTPPLGTTAATVTLSGGGGGAGGYEMGHQPSGGTGAEVTTTLNVTAATGPLAVNVGCGGASNLGASQQDSAGGAGYAAGGSGPAFDHGQGSPGGAGGGASGLCVAAGSGSGTSCGTPLTVAGGGGGSGGEDNCSDLGPAAGNGGPGAGGSSGTVGSALVANGGPGLQGDDGQGQGGDGGQGTSGGTGGSGSSGYDGAQGSNTPWSSAGGAGALADINVVHNGGNGGGGGGGYTGGGGGGAEWCASGVADGGGGGGGSSAVATSLASGTPTVQTGAGGGLGGQGLYNGGGHISEVSCPAQGGQSYPSGCPGYVTVTWTVNTTTTSLTSSPNPSSFGQAVTLTAIVSGQTGMTPTGTVSFVDTANGRETDLASGVALTNGTASTQVVLPAVEANAITATYSGDSGNGPSTSPAETAFVVPVAHQLVVTQLRFSGPGATGRGIDDWYVNLVNNTAFPLQLAGWILGVAYSDGGTAGLPMPTGLTLPPGGAYLAAGSDYSLNQVAFPDFALSDQLSADIIGAQIAPPNGGAAVDEVGYPNAPSGYQGSAGALPTLTPAVPSPGVQYAFVRHGSQAVPVDTNNNGADFSLVSVDGGTVGGQTAVVGTPSPLSTTSAVEQANATMPSTLIDPAQSASACPNRIYIPGAAGAPGTLVVNRTITNDTGTIITLGGLRITSLTQQGGPPTTTHAWLRAVPTTVTTSPCGGPMGQPLTLNAPAGTDGDGGLGTTLSPANPFLPPGGSITVAFQFAVDQGGPFTFGYDVDILHNT